MRDINDILKFRSDLPPFLVHLTRCSAERRSATDNLRSILAQTALRAGEAGHLISDARFGCDTRELSPEERRRFFHAVSLTETPINEIHSLLEIGSRRAELEPYGIVFLKDRLASKGVEPAWYINNILNDKNPLVQRLAGLIDTDPETAEQVLPLIAVFGTKLTAPGAHVQRDFIDFRWEREWRFPARQGPLTFSIETDVFLGLCPDEEIQDFEGRFPRLLFVDPRRNLVWYARKLIAARQRLDLQSSVV